MIWCLASWHKPWMMSDLYKGTSPVMLSARCERGRQRWTRGVLLIINMARHNYHRIIKIITIVSIIIIKKDQKDYYHLARYRLGRAAAESASNFTTADYKIILHLYHDDMVRWLFIWWQCWFSWSPAPSFSSTPFHTCMLWRLQANRNV